MRIRLSEKGAANARRFLDIASKALDVGRVMVPGLAGAVLGALSDLTEAVSDALEDASDGGRKITRDEALGFAKVFVEALEARGAVQQ